MRPFTANLPCRWNFAVAVKKSPTLVLGGDFSPRTVFSLMTSS
jgi:hypothetical protein